MNDNVKSDFLDSLFNESPNRSDKAELKKRRRYDDAFKREAVRMLVESGKPVATVALAIGIDRTNLQKWSKKFSQEFTTKSAEPKSGGVAINEFISLKREVESMKETMKHLRTIVQKSLTDKYTDQP